MKVTKEIESLLKSHNMTLVRHNKHLVYKHPDGRIFTRSSTPSDSFHGELNNLADLKRFLGIKRESTPKVVTPKKKKLKTVAVPPPQPLIIGGEGIAGTLLSSQLQSAYAHDPAMWRFYLRRRLLKRWKNTPLKIEELSRLEYSLLKPLLPDTSGYFGKFLRWLRKTLQGLHNLVRGTVIAEFFRKLN